MEEGKKDMGQGDQSIEQKRGIKKLKGSVQTLVLSLCHHFGSHQLNLLFLDPRDDLLAKYFPHCAVAHP